MSSVAIDRRIYLGSLPAHVSPHQIADALVDFKSASVCIFNPSTRTNRGSYAFVTFDEDTDLDAAVLKLSGLKIGGRTVAVAKADPKKKETSKETASASASGSTDSTEDAADKQTKPARAPRKKLPESDDTVYVSNIPLEISASEIDELFKEFDGAATIVTKPARKRRQGNRVIQLASKSYAFVKVGAGNQERAIEALNDTEFQGEKLSVSKASVSPEEFNQTQPESSE